MSIFDEGDEISFYDGVPDDIRAKHEEWANVSSKLKNKLLSKGVPVQAVFEITPLCNLSCKMCFVRLEKDKMDSLGKLMTGYQWKKITEETAELGVYAILITGGEPFTHPEFIDIYLNIVRLGFRVILFTNGVMLNDRIIDTLKKYPPNYLYITIYGNSEETYEKVCGNGKAYNSVINNIKVYKEILKNIPITLRTTVIKENLHDIMKLREFAQQMQMKFTYCFGTIKPVRGAECQGIKESRLSPEEIIETRKGFFDSIKDEQLYNIYKKAIKTQEKNLLEYDAKKINFTDDIKNLNCAAANSIYTISWDGKMLPCQNFSSPYTLPLNIGIKAAWDDLKNIKKTIKVPERCIKCRYRYYCGKCPAIIQSESGTYIDNEPYNCMQSYK